MGKNSSFSAFEIVLDDDKALDESAMLTEEVRCADGKDRKRAELFIVYGDPAVALVLPGKTLTKIKCRALRQKTVNRLVEDLQQPSSSELWDLVAASIIGIDSDNPKLKLSDEDLAKADHDGARVLTPDAMERVAAALGIQRVRQIARKILRRSLGLEEWYLGPFVSVGGSEASSSPIDSPPPAAATP